MQADGAFAHGRGTDGTTALRGSGSEGEQEGKTKSGDGERQDTEAWKMSFSNWNL
jgi:hypothetical protein